MLNATFDALNHSAAISGAYQYDTGQRLRLSGLPSPEEMTEADDMLTGELPAVQVQYGWIGDSQTEMRLAQWDDDRWCWLADIPDAYLTRHEAVHVYVYISYGGAGGGRNKTMYEGVFTPISRPAPSTTVTAEQIERWNTLEAEVELALVSAQTSSSHAASAAQNANAAAQNALIAAEAASEAAHDAQDAADRLGDVDARWEGMTAAAVTPAEIRDADAYFRADNLIWFELPRGETGAKGATGDTGPADIALSFSDGVLTITPK